MAMTRHRLAALVITLALAAFALWLRTVGLTAKPLWLDEAYSAFAASQTFDFLWHVVPQYETHPPVYYSMLRGWTLIAGDSLIALRSFGVIAGIATIAILAWVVRGVARVIGFTPGQRLQLLAVTLMLAALLPSLVEMSREVRPYPWLILAYALALGTQLRIVNSPRIDWRVLAPYLAALAWLLWLHNLAVLYAATLTLGLLILLWGRSLTRPEWRTLIIGQLLVGLCWLPGLLILSAQAGAWVAKTWLTFKLGNVFPTIQALWSAPDTLPGLLAVALMLTAIIGRWWREQPIRLPLTLLIYALVPPLLAAAISMTIAPVFLMRTLTPVAVPAILLMAMGTIQPGLWRWLGVATAVLLALNLGQSNYQMRHRPYWEDWYRVTDLLAQRVKPGDEIWTYPNEAALPLNRALQDRGLHFVVRPLPVPVPAIGVQGLHPTGSVATVSITRDELRALAATPDAQRVPVIWIIRQGANAYDPGDDLPAVMAEQRDEIWKWYRRPIEIRGYRKR